jgi:putative DNA primase/helicase
MATTEIAPFQFPVIEAWNTPVTVEDVLDETLDCFVHYTHVKAHAGEEDLAIRDAHVAASLWACATWFVADCPAFPYLLITAPERDCGKSTLQNLLTHLARNPLKTSDSSAAAIYYACEFQPTLLIDEVDSFLKKDPQLIGILNSGYTADGTVIRVDGDGKSRQL